MGISKKSSNVCTSLSSSRREAPQIDLARALSREIPSPSFDYSPVFEHKAYSFF